VSVEAVRQEVDRFVHGPSISSISSIHSSGPSASSPAVTLVDFVCEEDVRQAMKTGQSIAIHDRTIVTPAARDLGEAHKVFVHGLNPITRIT
jgi:hypothetical protein